MAQHRRETDAAHATLKGLLSEMDRKNPAELAQIKEEMQQHRQEWLQTHTSLKGQMEDFIQKHSAEIARWNADLDAQHGGVKTWVDELTRNNANVLAQHRRDTDAA